MTKLITLFSSAVIVTVFCFFAVPGQMKKIHAPVANGFAVVELFTSEGYSSCPPADEAVIQLVKEYPDRVYVLGYHVDYWNQGGWRDQFSKLSFTERQKTYAQQFNLSSIYTPEIVVNGKKEFVGSNSKLLKSTVHEELQANNPAPVKLTVVMENDKTVKVGYEAAVAVPSFLNIALVQLKATTAVRKGENEGRSLNHINIVRELKTIKGNKDLNGTVSFTLPNSLSSKDVEIVGFLQNKNDLKITGAAAASIK